MPPPLSSRHPASSRARDQILPCQIRYSTPRTSAWSFIQFVTCHPASSCAGVGRCPMALPKVRSQARPSGCSRSEERRVGKEGGWGGGGDGRKSRKNRGEEVRREENTEAAGTVKDTACRAEDES